MYTVASTVSAPATIAKLTLALFSILSVAVVFSAAHRFVSHGGQVLLVQTGSMRPMIRPGDAVIVWPTPVDHIRNGDVVSYNSKVTPGVVMTHRVVSINTKTQKLTTQGDSNKFADPPVAASQVIGRASYIAPHLGRFVGWLRTPLGLSLAVYLPAAIAIGQQARQLTRQLKPRFYTVNRSR